MALRGKQAEVAERIRQLEMHLNRISKDHGFSSFYHKIAIDAMDDPKLANDLLSYLMPKLKSVEANITRDMPQRLIINAAGVKSFDLDTTEVKQIETVDQDLTIPPISLPTSEEIGIKTSVKKDEKPKRKRGRPKKK